jgi:hypothetical protein
MHIANAKRQKSLGASINVKPRAGVFPLRAKIWDALDEARVAVATRRIKETEEERE